MKKHLSGMGDVVALWSGVRHAALAILLIAASLAVSQAQAPTSAPPDGDIAGATVLTRGPVHEAFAAVIAYNPEPGIVVSKAPPALIEEMPPDEKPEGDNVTWIPGYWSWDDERNDYLWVSGTWRALPPGREWRAGYWSQTSQGYQWISGYWADTSAKETTYLPPPPATVEVGPNVAAPSDDYIWIPGCWVWIGGHYAWRPGYWVPGRADWDWFPSYYVWTPRGYVYVDGYWDYPVMRRGCVFAPVYFQPGIYVRHGFYSPRIVIGFDVFSEHLFIRPRYCHYYFGDYYGATYVSSGFYASFSFQSGRHGYDPIFAHERWRHRSDRNWEHRVEVAYQNRRDHVEARPPRTWAEERNVKPAAAGGRDGRAVAMPFDQMAKRKDGPVKFQPVAQPERQQLAQRNQEVQKSREQRQTIEAKGGNPTPKPAGGKVEPVRAEFPRSPIVAKQANQLRGNDAPPKAPKSPKPGPPREVNLSSQRNAEAERQRPPEAQPQPIRPPESKPQPIRPAELQTRPLPPEAKPQESRPAESLPQPRGPEAQPQPIRPPEAQTRPLPPEARPAPIRPSEAQPRPLPPEAKPQPIRPSEATPRPRPPEIQTRPLPPEAQPQPIRPPEARPEPPRVSPPVKPRPNMNERGASRLMQNDRSSNRDKGR